LSLENQTLRQNLQQALPAALQAAGINLSLVSGYIPAVLNALVPALAQGQVQTRRRIGATMFVAESAPLAAQILGSDPNGFTAAARPVQHAPRTAMNPMPVQVGPAVQLIIPAVAQPAPPAPQMVAPIAPPRILPVAQHAQPVGDPPTLIE